MNRIVERFARLKREGKKGFIVYIGAGDPDLEATRRLALAFDQAGVDVLELGVPFSDPLADGLVNQLAAQRGLESGATPPKVLETVAAIRRDSQIPIVLYIYFNLIHRVGLEQFIKDAAKAGVDGMLVLDLPPEESDNYESLMRQAGLCHIYLVAPTTPEDRMEFIVKRGAGFIYYISREGVTGHAGAGGDEPCATSRQNPRAHDLAGGRRLRHLESRTGETRRVVVGRRGGGQRGGESNCRTRQIAGTGETRGRVCEVAGGGGEGFVNQKRDSRPVQLLIGPCWVRIQGATAANAAAGSEADSPMPFFGPSAAVGLR